MGKVFVVALATLFVCGIVLRYVPFAMDPVAGNSHGITWTMVLGVVAFFGSWRLVSK